MHVDLKKELKKTYVLISYGIDQLRIILRNRLTVTYTSDETTKYLRQILFLKGEYTPG